MSDAMDSPFPANGSRCSPSGPGGGEAAGSPSGTRLQTRGKARARPAAGTSISRLSRYRSASAPPQSNQGALAPSAGDRGRAQRLRRRAGHGRRIIAFNRTRTTLDVLKTLLWRFRGADGGSRCFPSYERIARVAKCCRDSVCVVIAALEEAGILTWVHRITRIRRRGPTCWASWSLAGR
jgi:hypothetical protein